MKLRIQHFNLIEVLLAMLLLAFGLVVILGMLPSGLRATADAATQGYAGEIADQITEYIYKHGKDMTGLPEKQTKTETDYFLSTFSADQYIMQTYGNLLQRNNDNAALENYSRTGTNGVYEYSSVPGTFVLVMGDSFNNNTETRVDFSALIRVWKSPREIERFYLNDDSVKSHLKHIDHDCHAEGCFNGLNESSGTHELYQMEPQSNQPQGWQYNIEISWPLSKDYALRNKAYYSVDGND